MLAHSARITRIHARLVLHLKSLVNEASIRGRPAQRPLFLHFEDDPRADAAQDACLHGPDLIVAPVVRRAGSAFAKLSAGPRTL